MWIFCYTFVSTKIIKMENKDIITLHEDYHGFPIQYNKLYDRFQSDDLIYYRSFDLVKKGIELYSKQISYIDQLDGVRFIGSDSTGTVFKLLGHYNNYENVFLWNGTKIIIIRNEMAKRLIIIPNDGNIYSSELARLQKVRAEIRKLKQEENELNNTLKKLI